MSDITEEQWEHLQIAAGQVVAKLQTFHAGLSPTEQTALELALQQLGVKATDPQGEVEGYINMNMQSPQFPSFGQVVGATALLGKTSFRVNTLTFSSNATGIG